MSIPLPGHPASLPDDALLRDCEVERTRRSGPGGQHRNKVETAIVLRYRPTGTKSEASERRSQSDNLAAALFRLRVTLALEYRVARPDIPAVTSTDAGTTAPTLDSGGMSSPSELFRARCQGGKIRINPEHHDFPSLLAEVLDVLTAFQMDLKPTADWFGCSASQLIRLLQEEPRALQQVNEHRLAQGLHKLK